MQNNHYKLVTIADGKADADAISDVFCGIYEGKLISDLMLVNYYDEVPVCYPAKVAGVDGQAVELTVHEHQALIMSHEKSALIKSRHFHEGLGVHCYTSYVSIGKKTVMVHNFSYAQIRAERREAVRVRVRDPVGATFRGESGSLSGRLVDISGTGVSMICRGQAVLSTGDGGELQLELGGTTVVAPGLFVRARHHGENESVCMFQIKPDHKNESLISQFIYQRQVEIVRELKEKTAEK